MDTSKLGSLTLIAARDIAGTLDSIENEGQAAELLRQLADWHGQLVAVLMQGWHGERNAVSSAASITAKAIAYQAIW